MTMVDRTCEAMARGGIYDQLAGGFARYSVDAGWVVPHFEKMLYDNALLLGVVHALVAAHRPTRWRSGSWPRRWLAADARCGPARAGSRPAWTPTPSTITADYARAPSTPGTGTSSRRCSATRMRRWAAEVSRVTAAGTFEDGASTLQRLADPVDPERWTAIRDRLRAARERRARPARDDKIVAAWNGWLVDSLVQAAMVFDRPDWLAAATEAARLSGEAHWLDGRLRRASRDGRGRSGVRRSWRTTPPWPRRSYGWLPRPETAAWLERAPRRCSR